VIVKNYSVFQVVRELEPHPTRVRLWAQNGSGKALDGETRVVVLRMDGRLTIQDLRGQLLHDMPGCKDFFLQPVSTLPKRDATQLWVSRHDSGLELWLPKSNHAAHSVSNHIPGNVQTQPQMQQVQRRNSIFLAGDPKSLSPNPPQLFGRPQENILEFKKLVVDSLGGMIPLGIDSKHGTILLAKRVWHTDRNSDNPAISIRTQRRTFFDRLIAETLPLEGVERTVKFAKESFDHGLFQPTKTMHLFLRQTLKEIDPRFAKNLPGGATKTPLPKKKAAKLTDPCDLSTPQRSELKKRTVSMSETVGPDEFVTDEEDELEPSISMSNVCNAVSVFTIPDGPSSPLRRAQQGQQQQRQPGSGSAFFAGGSAPAGSPEAGGLAGGEGRPGEPEHPSSPTLRPPLAPGAAHPVEVTLRPEPLVTAKRLQQLVTLPLPPTPPVLAEDDVATPLEELPLGIQFLQRLDCFEEVVLRLAVMEVEQKLWPLLFKICGQPDKLFSQLVYPTVVKSTGVTRDIGEKRLETAVNFLRVLELFDFSTVETRAKELMAQCRRQGADRIIPLVQKYMERVELIQKDVDAGEAPPCIDY